MIDLKTLHINGYAAMYRVIEISSSRRLQQHQTVWETVFL